MSEFVPIEQLLNCSRDPQQAQAAGPEGTRSWQQWRHRVAQWRAALAEQSGGTWALYDADVFEFSAALFALWASGKVACVPGSNQPLICKKLEERVAGFIGDFAAGPGRRLLAAPSEQGDALDQPITLDRLQPAMEIFTSGSSGEPQAVPKALFQLSEEVSNLERLWGELARGTSVAATVSHHHIYGLLFRVLWPLAAGRPFSTDISEYLEALSDPAADQPIVLISSPSHLSRIPEQNDWTALRKRCRAIFSSGAPLPRDASLSAARLLGHAPIEVFGSSETGGIATRQQALEQEVPWQAVPGLRIELDADSECLKIQSPYISPELPGEWYLTSDRVRLEGEGRFHLLGRADRIAKVEGKRVSLSEMEQRLESHELVKQARVLVLNARRTELAAVVVLSSAGSTFLADSGRRAMNGLLAEHLLQQFERPVLPRRWRYPRELPMNSHGKVPQDELVKLFTGPSRGRPLFPEVLTSETEGAKVKMRLYIPPDLLYFQGHFPTAAILPGVVQLKWARHFGAEKLAFAGDFSHLEAVKFQHVIRPGQEVVLDLEHKAGSQKLAFRYHSAAGQHASGRFVNKAPARVQSD